MDTMKKLLFSFFHLLLLSFLSGQQQQVLGHRQLHRFRPKKLFVFGDSYVDTGNFEKNIPGPWMQPYGITVPGKPNGRFSDGNVSTDYLAMLLRIDTPIPFRASKNGTAHVENGINFALGGTGVFHTATASDKNMTTQIDTFQQVVKKADLKSSMALVSVAGNDYLAYGKKHYNDSTIEEWKAFIVKVVKQLTLNLKRIHKHGVKQIVVPSLPPLGCVPVITSNTSFQRCNETVNYLVDYHNLLLQQTVANLNNETKDSAFLIVDLNGAFINILKNGSSKFENLLKPCCVGIGKGNNCGSVDAHGVKMYTLCAKPKASFFWDGVHPTHEGWGAIYSALKAELQKIYN